MHVFTIIVVLGERTNSVESRVIMRLLFVRCSVRPIDRSSLTASRVHYPRIHCHLPCVCLCLRSGSFVLSRERHATPSTSSSSEPLTTGRCRSDLRSHDLLDTTVGPPTDDTASRESIHTTPPTVARSECRPSRVTINDRSLSVYACIIINYCLRLIS